MPMADERSSGSPKVNGPPTDYAKFGRSARKDPWQCAAELPPGVSMRGVPSVGIGETRCPPASPSDSTSPRGQGSGRPKTAAAPRETRGHGGR